MMILRRLLFALIVIPWTLLAVFVVLPVGLIAWIVTGSEDKAGDLMADVIGLPNWLILGERW